MYYIYVFNVIAHKTVGDIPISCLRGTAAAAAAAAALLLLLLLLLPLLLLLFRTTWVGRYQKGKTSLDLKAARDNGVLGCSSISWTICKQPAPCSRQIPAPTPHHLIFTGRILFLMPNQQCQSTTIPKGRPTILVTFARPGTTPEKCYQGFCNHCPKFGGLSR